MLLYMIRHGESTANLAKVHAGWAQVPLSPQGERDAERAKKALDGVSFNKIYASDLIRAVQTAQIARPACPFTQTSLLREISVGELAGKSVAECHQIYGDSYLENRAARNYRPYGGEAQEDQLQRIRAFCALLESDPAERVAAFCHEGSIQCMLQIATQAKGFLPRQCQNGGVCIFSFDGRQWSLVEWDIYSKK